MQARQLILLGLNPVLLLRSTEFIRVRRSNTVELRLGRRARLHRLAVLSNDGQIDVINGYRRIEF